MLEHFNPRTAFRGFGSDDLRDATVGRDAKSVVRGQRIRHGDNTDTAQGVPLEDWSVEAKELAAPPVASHALLLARRKPVLPQHRADLARRGTGKGIAGEKRQHVGVVGQQALFGSRNQRVLLPRCV